MAAMPMGYSQLARPAVSEAECQAKDGEDGDDRFDCNAVAACEDIVEPLMEVAEFCVAGLDFGCGCGSEGRHSHRLGVSIPRW